MTEYALGRHVEHDERSRGFQALMSPRLATVQHRHFGPVLDQLKLGSCTGNALAQALNCRPFHKPREHPFTEAFAVNMYVRGTQLDDVPGQMPDEDTGSTALGVAKAAVEAGVITAYHHAFGFDQFLAALVLTPVMMGTSWHRSMFRPDADGTLHLDGDVVGGHEYLATGIDLPRKRIRILNSWSSHWGIMGTAWLSFDNARALLADRGDAMVLVR